MKYIPPLNEPENASYVDGDASKGTLGSRVPAASLEHPQREIVNVISESGLTPSSKDTDQLYKAIRKLCAPAGQIMMWGGASGASVPKGFLYCNGQAVSRTKYADLFAVIGTTHGAGNGANTFNVPNMRGRFALGGDNDITPGDTGGSWTKTLDTGNSTVDISGKTKGHQLSEAEMPEHYHFIANTDIPPTFTGKGTYTHYVLPTNSIPRAYTRSTQNSGNDQSYWLPGTSAEPNVGRTSKAGNDTAHDHDVNISKTGNHNHAITNMDVTNPYYTLIYMIRT
ncbi:MAG: tail fiber protein [Alphaproteobacteria bacterium]|nr:tail fiber protein [Alphaproteobacteria bacterium]